MSNASGQLPAALEGFGERLVGIYGADGAQDVLATMRRPKKTGYWVNPLRLGSPLTGSTPVAGLDGYWTVPDALRQEVLHGDAAETGQIYPMNPSSLLAVEPARGRFHRMRANLSRCGVSIADFYLRDGRGVGFKVPAPFDGVLLDAPCSSEARIRLDDPGTYFYWKQRKIREAARKQRALFASAYRAVKPVGRVVYCTCAFAPEENELVVQQLLAGAPDAKVGTLSVSAPEVTSGLGAWRGKDLHPDVSGAVRIVPDALWDGFFLCRIEKPA